jgi:inosine-uridine nucleoside N-ribohydrolase
MKKLVIDTDIGTDPDDLIALAYAIKNKAKIKLILTEIEKNQTRAKIARKLINILGIKVPIIPGEDSNLGGRWYCGFEHLVLNEQDIKKPIQRQDFPKCDEDDILVGISSMTNLANRIKINPSMKKINQAHIMGYCSDNHNFKVDPKAAEFVVSQPWTKYYITKEVSKKISFSIQDFKKFKGTELGNLIYDSAMGWINFVKKPLYPMYDVLTISSAIGEEFVKFKPYEKNSFISYDVDESIKNKIIQDILR